HNFTGRYWDTATFSSALDRRDYDNPAPASHMTGDFGYFNDQGMLILVGRKDSRVKIRGYTVSVWEVEACLDKLPGVLESIVVLDASKTRLLAYVVPDDSDPTSIELRQGLQESLPEYMIPSQIMFLSALPVGQSGKIDQSLLPPPTRERPETSTEISAPTTSLELSLAGLWSEFLEIDSIGIHDNFYELGGHSLLLTQMLSAISIRYGKQVLLADFHPSPTVAHLASLIESSELQDPVLLSKSEFTTEASFQQQGFIFTQLFSPDSSEYNMSKSFRLQGKLSIDALESALRSVIVRHPVLRSRVVVGKDVQQVVAVDQFSFRVERYSSVDRSCTEYKDITREFVSRPFDIASDLMVRAAVVAHAPEEHTFILVTHHLATDHHSATIVLRDLEYYYNREIIGSTAELPTPEALYGQYAAWQREAVKHSQYQLKEWRDHLQGVPTVPFGITSQPQRHDSTGSEDPRIYRELDSDAYQSLIAIARWSNSSVFCSLLTVLTATISSMTGAKEFAVGIPHSQRNHAELKEVVGCFINVLVARCHFDCTLTCTQFAGKIADEMAWVLEHQQVPFQQLVNACRTPGTYPAAPLFNVMLDYVVSEGRSLRLTNVLAEQEQVYHQSHYDLTLYVYHRKEGISCAWGFEKTLFDEKIRSAYIATFDQLLSSIANCPDARLDSLVPSRGVKADD
ncbi:MAG: hypothetical protein HKN42_14780, partial [Granulosicoccus sp.]|nr:hypothetical protein [Granulosicoccus sp.]